MLRTKTLSSLVHALCTDKASILGVAATCLISTTALAGGSNCCVANGGVGCDDAACEAAVCAIDPFCCDVAWDGICAGEANDLCAVCQGGGGDSNCCTANGGVGCDDPACEAAVCAIDPFCCDVAWDGICASEANDLCAVCQGGGSDCPASDHDCFSTGGPGCSDTACCDAVCAIDPFCCDVSWDGICVSEANDLCDGPLGCPKSDHDCFTTGGPGCTDTVCCNAVCAVDPFCCDVSWDGICVSEANDLCDGGGDPCKSSDHDCLTTGGPGCTDTACCQTVCELDPFCCDVSWDGICVAEAEKFCGGGVKCNKACPADLNFDGQVDGGDYGLVLAAWGTNDPCADLSGDGLVDGADTGLLLAAWGPCPPTGVCPPADNDCCTASGLPGCSNVDCCETVCALDPFCCDVAWDSICVDEAAANCDIKCGSTCESADHDCFTTGGPGCTDIACCESVCAIDPFCCDVSWDGICVSEAGDLCGGGGSACDTADHDCFTTGGPGCTDVACCKAVCAVDPFCCDVSWDGICVSEAGDLCGGGGSACDTADHDCFTTGGPGCTDVACCKAVCAIDPFCCDVSWDGICVGEAGDLCGGGGSACDTADHDCFTTGGPGCTDVACCKAVCAIDPFCCDTSWDGICVSEAGDLCGGGGSACDTADHDCFTTGGPGCTDVACCKAVCAVDPFCCDVSWDGICVSEAGDLCGGGGSACDTADHDCFTTGGPGCTDVACCKAVCAVDPFCCDVSWDSICVGEAGDLCGGGGSACDTADHDCFTTGGPGCTDVACCKAVCAVDPFCCDVSWDSICVGEAGDLCGGGGSACDTATHDCFTTGGPGCTDVACCEAVCAVDPFCCDVSWDGICVGEAGDLCGGAGSNCCVPNGGVGCDDDVCEACVCGIDPFCCDVAWDGICASEAINQCAGSCPCG